MDGIFDVSTFTEPRFRRWSQIRPRLGLVVGLIHDGTSAGIFAMQDLSSGMDTPYEIKIFIPTDTDFKGWGGKWWPLNSVVNQFPESEIAKHFSGIGKHPENYIWIYPNLEQYFTEDWFQEILNATPDLKQEAREW